MLDVDLLAKVAEGIGSKKVVLIVSVDNTCPIGVLPQGALYEADSDEGKTDQGGFGVVMPLLASSKKPRDKMLQTKPTDEFIDRQERYAADIG